MIIQGITFPDDIKVEQRFGQRITYDKKNPIHWREMDINHINLTKPTILCFGGIGTTNDKDANFVAKMIQRLLGINAEANLVSIVHSHYMGETAARYFDEDKEEHLRNHIKESYDIVDALFLPIVCDKNGNRLMVQEACRNVRNINIFAHCYGYFSTVNYVEDALKSTLEMLCYTEDEIRQILKQIFVVSYEAGDIFQTGFSNLNINSVNSELWRDIVLAFPERDLSTAEMFDGEAEKIMASQMYQTKEPALVEKFLRNNKYLLLKEGNVIDILTNGLTIDKTDHDLSTIYMHQDKSYSYYTNELGRIVSQTIAAALKIALDNSIENNYTTRFKPLDMDKIFAACDKSLKLSRTYFGMVSDLDFS